MTNASRNRRNPLGVRSSIDRREFIRRIGVMSLGAAAGGLLPGRGWASAAAGGLLPGHGWASHREDGLRLSETRKKLGTFFQITVIHDPVQEAKDIVEVAFQEVDRLSDLLNRHREGSTVWRLNRAGTIDGPPAELTDLVRRSIEWNRLTGGCLEITVEPVESFFKSHFDRYRTPPPEEEIQELADRIGSEYIHLDGSRIRFGKEGMGITLDGIAKGFVVDRAMEVVREYGVRSALINAGGDIRAIGGRGDGSPWTVAVQDPFRPDRSVERFELLEGAVATSGNYEIFYDREKVYHHIVNPATGHSPPANAGSTVRCSRTTEADALSTALMVMGPEAGIEFIDRLEGVEGLVITRDGNRHVSGNWERAADFF